MCPLLPAAWSLHGAALAALAASPAEGSHFGHPHEQLPLWHDRGSARALGRCCKAASSELLRPTRSSSARVTGLLRLATFNDRLHCCDWREQRGYVVPAPSAPSPGLSRAAPRDQVPGHGDSSAGVKLKQTVIVELKLVRNSWLVHVIMVDIAVVRAALG